VSTIWKYKYTCFLTPREICKCGKITEQIAGKSAMIQPTTSADTDLLLAVQYGVNKFI
jgi:hypothetical protein